MRRHVEETREATASLRRTMEQQQRQYQATVTDFQRKLEEASRRKAVATSQRIEISAESIRTLRTLVMPHGENACGTDATGSVGAENGEALRQWFGKVDSSLRRLLRVAASKVEARRSLQTVSMIVHNLVTNPTQDKFREVNTASARFRETFGAADSGAAELLQLAGFECQDQSFVFPSGRGLDDAERVRDFMQDALRDCDRRWEEACSDSSNIVQDTSATCDGVAADARGGSAIRGGMSAEAVGIADGHDALAASPTVMASPTGRPVTPPAPWMSTVGFSNLGMSSTSASSAAGAGASSAGPGGGVGNGAASAGSPPAEAPRPHATQPWLSSVVQKSLAQRPSGSSGVAEGSGGASSTGSDAARRPAEAAAHPAEARVSSQEPQSGG